jgi:ankyrin repeat protein
MSLSKTTVATIVFWSILLLPTFCLAKADCSRFSEPNFYRTATKGEIVNCIEQGVDLFSRSQGGETPLHWVAIHSSKPDIIDLILSRIVEDDQRNEYLNARTKEGKSAIHRVRLTLGLGTKAAKQG